MLTALYFVVAVACLYLTIVHLNWFSLINLLHVSTLPSVQWKWWNVCNEGGHIVLRWCKVQGKCKAIGTSKFICWYRCGKINSVLNMLEICCIVFIWYICLTLILLQSFGKNAGDYYAEPSEAFKYCTVLWVWNGQCCSCSFLLTPDAYNFINSFTRLHWAQCNLIVTMSNG